MSPPDGPQWPGELNVRPATSLVPRSHAPGTVSRLGRFLRGGDPEWELELDAAGFGLRGAALRWAWAELERVVLVGGRTPSSLTLQTANARLESVHRMLPVRAAQGASVERLHRFARDLAAHANAAFDDRSTPAGDLIERATRTLRETSARSREIHSHEFSRDPLQVTGQPDASDPDQLSLALGGEAITVTTHHVGVAGERYGFHELDAVDFAVVADPHADVVLRAQLLAVHQGRPHVLHAWRISGSGLCQAHWIAQFLDARAQTTPFAEVPDALQTLRR